MFFLISIVAVLTGFLAFQGVVLMDKDSLGGLLCLIGATLGVVALIICRRDI